MAHRCMDFYTDSAAIVLIVTVTILVRDVVLPSLKYNISISPARHISSRR